LKRFGLSTAEKLKSRREIKRVISFGITIFSTDKKIKAIYIVEKGFGEAIVQITPAVFKRLGCAVWRNRLKRLIRESYRLNKEDLVIKIKQKNKKLKIIFSPQNINEETNKQVKLKYIMPGMLDVIKKIKESI